MCQIMQQLSFVEFAQCIRCKSTTYPTVLPQFTNSQGVALRTISCNSEVLDTKLGWSKPHRPTLGPRSNWKLRDVRLCGAHMWPLTACQWLFHWRTETAGIVGWALQIAIAQIGQKSLLISSKYACLILVGLTFPHQKWAWLDPINGWILIIAIISGSPGMPGDLP